MPLRAIIDGQDVIAPFLSIDEWESLRHSIKTKEKELRLPCCQNTGHLRTSKLGTNHFVHHRKDGCGWKSETVEYLKAKAEIALACRDAGYEVATEARGDAWKADVLATKGTGRVAFEIQWSRQELEETHRRQEQYQRDGVRGCWFFKSPPKEMRGASKELPLFALSLDAPEDGGSFSVKIHNPFLDYLPQPSYGLYEFVKALLNRRIRFCQEYKAKKHQQLRIVFIEMGCWRCKKISHIYYISNQIVSCCGQSMFRTGTLWDSDKLEFNKAVLNEVMRFTNSPKGSHIKLGTIKPRYSKTVRGSYRSFGCYHCDAIFGDWFISEETLHARYYEDSAPAVLEPTIVMPDPLLTESGGHWCFPEDGAFCE